MAPSDRIIVALDVKEPSRALELAGMLAPHVGGFKIGLEFATSTYAQLMAEEQDHAVTRLMQLRELYQAVAGKLFWDGKWDDIPNTVKGAAEGIQSLGPKYVNLHASAGRQAIAQVVAAKGSSMVLGVTVLTSFGEDECESVFGDKPGPKVLYFARMLAEEGADGIICSPQELELLGQHEELNKLQRVTPGVRPAWASTGDQRRVMTPGEAIRAGATALVIGRPITNPPAEIGSPVDAAQQIAREIEEAL